MVHRNQATCRQPSPRDKLLPPGGAPGGELFCQIDKNQDGLIDRAEFAAFIRSASTSPYQVPGPQQVPGPDHDDQPPVALRQSDDPLVADDELGRRIAGLEAAALRAQGASTGLEEAAREARDLAAEAQWHMRQIEDIDEQNLVLEKQMGQIRLQARGKKHGVHLRQVDDLQRTL